MTWPKSQAHWIVRVAQKQPVVFSGIAVRGDRGAPSRKDFMTAKETHFAAEHVTLPFEAC